MSYSDYLKSEHWKEIKKSVYQKHKSCRICKSSDDLNIHHRTYKNLHKEAERDLVVLCSKCHEMWHSKFKFKRLSDNCIRRIILILDSGKSRETAISLGINRKGLEELKIRKPSLPRLPNLSRIERKKLKKLARLERETHNKLVKSNHSKISEIGQLCNKCGKTVVEKKGMVRLLTEEDQTYYISKSKKARYWYPLYLLCINCNITYSESLTYV